jgi:hypothetical protein
VRIKTEINGITTTQQWKDGDTVQCVNLRKRHGSLMPVAPRRIVRNSAGDETFINSEYDIVYIHRMPTFENWICVNNLPIGNADVLYRKATRTDDDIIALDEDLLLGHIDGEHVTGIEAVGNMLSIITPTHIYYALYKNSSYTWLGQLPDLPEIRFSTISGDAYSDTSAGFNLPQDVITQGRQAIIDFFKAKVYKGLDNLTKEESGTRPEGIKFYDAHLLRYCFRLYDGSLVKFSPPILIAPQRKLWEENAADAITTNSCMELLQQTATPNFQVRVWAYLLQLVFDFSWLTAWEDIITGVEVFISQPLGINNPEQISEEFLNDFYDSPNNLNFIPSMPKDGNEKIRNTTEFYLIKSIKPGTVAITGSGTSPLWLPDTDISFTNWENIVHQEQMGIDSFSHHDIGANVTYTYNSRLHLADINTQFFKGFNPAMWAWYTTYNGDSVDYFPGTQVLINVDIKLNDGKHTVSALWTGTAGFLPHLSAFLSYPDPRAQQMRIYRNDTAGQWWLVKTVELKPHSGLNIAYYLEGDIHAIDPTPTPALPMVVAPTVYQLPVIENEPNKIKVSELNNPMFFPNSQTYTVGNGKIIGMANIAQRISEGSFGQTPLYVFTDSGVYALQVGQGEVTYQQQSAPTSYEIPTNPNAIRETAYGVVFASKRGLCIIFGQQVTLLSQTINHPPKAELAIERAPQTQTILHAADRVLTDWQDDRRDFADYLANIEDVAYDAHNNEIILIEAEQPPFSFVLNLESKEWYLTDAKMKTVVKNTFPNLYIIENITGILGRIREYSKPETDEDGRAQAHISFITRPLSFGTTDYKKLERMILRGQFIRPEGKTTGEEGESPLSVTRPVVLNWWSMDGENFRTLRGIPLKTASEIGDIQYQSYKDLDLGLFPRAGYRFFLLGFAGIVDEQSQIDGIDTEIETDFNTTKMR